MGLAAFVVQKPDLPSREVTQAMAVLILRSDAMGLSEHIIMEGSVPRVFKHNSHISMTS